jgi:hypothetical protein
MRHKRTPSALTRACDRYCAAMASKRRIALLTLVPAVLVAVVVVVGTVLTHLGNAFAPAYSCSADGRDASKRIASQTGAVAAHHEAVLTNACSDSDSGRHLTIATDVGEFGSSSVDIEATFRRHFTCGDTDRKIEYARDEVGSVLKDQPADGTIVRVCCTDR